MRTRRSKPTGGTYDIYIGVDPGLSGGIAVLSNTEVIEVFKTPPTIQDFESAISRYTGKKICCIIEKVHSMPQNGGKANFTFGYVNGVLHTIFQLCKIPYEEHTPQKWMKLYGLKKQKGEDGTAWKNRIKAHAQKLFPNTKVTLWSADALLIAYYCRKLNK